MVTKIEMIESWALDYVRVIINFRLPTISIEDTRNIEPSIFLQGEDAETFLKECENLSEDLSIGQDIEYETLMAYVARPYIDSFWSLV